MQDNIQGLTIIVQIEDWLYTSSRRVAINLQIFKVHFQILFKLYINIIFITINNINFLALRINFIVMNILSQPKKQLKLPPLRRAPQVLPNIYHISYKVKKQTKTLSIFAESATVQKAISKLINFKSQKISCLQEHILNKISQPLKSLSYQSTEYKTVLDIVKQIFIHCGFQIKERDILVAIGSITAYKYAFFTSYQQHPYSLCCDQVIVIKSDQQKASLQCLECKLQIIKFLLNTDLSKSRQKQKQEERNKEKLKMSYSMMIASGKYLKYRIGKSSKLGTHDSSLSKLDMVNETMQKNQPFCQG